MTNNIFLKIILSPIAFLYYLGTWLRNKMFDLKVFKTVSPNVFTVNVGNLSVGGTGKTPMVEYLINNFSESQTAILSRGYSRKTKGFIEADLSVDASIIGDEPYQYWLKFGKKVSVFVGENRVEAYKKILKSKPNLKLLILDDAFQHRHIAAHFNIVLIDFNNMIDTDWIMPMGTLREAAFGLNRAQVIIISKCPEYLTQNEADNLKNRANKYLNTFIPILYTTIKYDAPIQFNGNEAVITNKIVVASGIANNRLFLKYCEQYYNIVDKLSFADHHKYSVNDIKKLESSVSNNNAILVTEKDYVKLAGMFSANTKAYYLPISVSFLFEGNTIFERLFENSMVQFHELNGLKIEN
jgi:tetraacyldisaccharide 4'-kinase